jgi:ectoine hydroxylase-related dioxygenase (phytanoyl-CoA dioxygenase family)
MNIKTSLEKEGYLLYENFIPRVLISDFKKRLTDLYAVRASTADKIYAEGKDIDNLKNVSVWWSQTVHNFEEFKKIKRLIDPIIQHNLENFDFYASDVVTIKAGSQWVSPHIDTPYRFKQWNFDQRMLGVQCIVALGNLSKESASTGLVPFSQKREFDIDKCYTGVYDRWFKDNVKQYNMPIGTLLLYHCRLLHSSMPNNTTEDRPALLLNYLNKNIINEVSKIDNVWTSNGQRS